MLTATKTFTVQEYLEQERSSNERLEYHYGEIILIPGESRISNKIIRNCNITLYNLLKNKKVEVYDHDVKLEIEELECYFYPDIVITKELEKENDPYCVQFPFLIIEVVSDSDKIHKQHHYLKMPSLQMIIYISHREMGVDVYRKQNNNEWLVKSYDGVNEVIEIQGLEISLSLKEIYEGVL